MLSRWCICREKDIDEVLQATTVFGNVSKGTLAKHEDLVNVFGTGDEDKICRIILAEGDLQVPKEGSVLILYLWIAVLTKHTPLLELL